MVATATFSFDATRCVVWLNPIEAGMPRAGDLCTRHADGMAPPKGWERIDRRNEMVEPPVTPEPVAATATAGSALTDDLLPTREPVKRKRKPAVKKRWEEVPSLFEPATAPISELPPVTIPPLSVPPVDATPAEPTPADPDPVPATQAAADGPATDVDANRWMPRFVTDEDLDGVLDATTPLLSRAFNNARPSDDSDDSEPVG